MRKICRRYILIPPVSRTFARWRIMSPSHIMAPPMTSSVIKLQQYLSKLCTKYCWSLFRTRCINGFICIIGELLCYVYIPSRFRARYNTARSPKRRHCACNVHFGDITNVGFYCYASGLAVCLMQSMYGFGCVRIIRCV